MAGFFAASWQQVSSSWPYSDLLFWGCTLTASGNTPLNLISQSRLFGDTSDNIKNRANRAIGLVLRNKLKNLGCLVGHAQSAIRAMMRGEKRRAYTGCPKVTPNLRLLYKYSFNPLLLLNPTDVEALILMASPVLGFRPFLALRRVLVKVLNPDREILPSFLRALPIAPIKDCSAAPAFDFRCHIPRHFFD